QVAFTRPPDIWTMDLARGFATRLTFTTPNAVRPVWSPDGRFVYFSNADGIFRKSVDGAGTEELLLKASPTGFVRSISPDGRYLLYGSGDVMLLPLTGESKPTPFLNSPALEQAAAFSPDGRWVAYSSDESGRTEIYVQGFPDRRGKWLISDDGGLLPAWRADGRELYWRTPDGYATAASIELQPSGVTVGKAARLVRITASGALFEPSRDGKRFLAAEPEDGGKELTMVVMQNWAARLPK
ncbi:MAG: hypothetical protein ACKVSF_12525, partial [Alphaproteobacteria bacterium]